MKKKTKKYIAYWSTVLITITTSWFIWKTWQKIDMLLGEGNLPYMIAGGIVLIAILFGLGHYSFKKLIQRL